MSDDPASRAAVFDALYTRDPDPWNFETSAYEAAKRDATIAMLGQRTFAHGVEFGCSTGVLSEQLAHRCREFLAVDVSRLACKAAQARLAGTAARVERMDIPEQWPGSAFDLMVFSEVLYFLGAEEIGQTSRQAATSLDPGGVCLLVNWTGPNDLPVSGDDAVRLFVEAGGWQVLNSCHKDTYRMDLLHLVRTPSPKQRSGRAPFERTTR